MADYIIPDAVLNDVKTMHAVKITASTLMRFNYSDPTSLLIAALTRAFEAGVVEGKSPKARGVIFEVATETQIQPKGKDGRAKPKMKEG